MISISAKQVERQKYILLAGTKRIVSNIKYKKNLAMFLGEMIVKEQDWILFNGGALNDCESSRPTAIDYFGAFGASKYLKNVSLKPQNKIYTLLPQYSNHSQHRIGAVEISKKKTSALRRFDLVAQSDAIITIEGGEGILNILELGISLNKPVLPLAFTGGSSEKVWNTYESEILEKFQIPVNSSEYHAMTNGSNEPEKIAFTAISILKRALRPVCFVIMPYRTHFNELYTNHLHPSIADAGYMPVRADNISGTGSILEDMANAIKSSRCVIADISKYNNEFNPNVFYEIGLAHAFSKDVILISLSSEPGGDELPTDIKTSRVIGYSQDKLPELSEKITLLLKNMYQ